MRLFLRLMSSSTLILAFTLTGAPRSAHAEITRFREVDPGRVYRGSQPESLEDFALLQKYGIRTIIKIGRAHV